MNRMRFSYTGVGCLLGLLLLGAGWAFGNFYLVVLGLMFVASSLALLTAPRP